MGNRAREAPSGLSIATQREAEINQDRSDQDVGLTVTIVYTREAPNGSSRPAGRIDATVLSELAWHVDYEPLNYVCGPTAFVERMADFACRGWSSCCPDTHGTARIKGMGYG
jgi:hypothetical protein